MAESIERSALAARVDVDLVEAMKRRDTTALDTLRLLKSAAKYAEVAKQHTLSDDEYQAVIRTQVKMRRDAALEYDRASRTDLAQRERAESAILEQYLPDQLDEEAVRTAVRAAIEQTGASSPADMGKVMNAAMSVLRGKADGALVSAAARDLLSGRSG
jgi:uncharacterized protein